MPRHQGQEKGAHNYQDQLFIVDLVSPEGVAKETEADLAKIMPMLRAPLMPSWGTVDTLFLLIIQDVTFEFEEEQWNRFISGYEEDMAGWRIEKTFEEL
ncbi:hypothetical protein LTR49_022143 [Elasticomyces elasticus]|nr:hypothetical protein LTR49_022143 [Elasticomyces elasticus]